MTVKELLKSNEFEVLNEGDNLNREISVPYCCDLLSVAMGKMPQGAAWVTVMANVNTLAVAALADAACVILAEGSRLDEAAKTKAREQGITVMYTDLPVFEAALKIYKRLNA
jgi:DRTGG domain.